MFLIIVKIQTIARMNSDTSVAAAAAATAVEFDAVAERMLYDRDQRQYISWCG
jgi:hypothetical protein